MLRARQRLDKYRIGRRIGEGGFANVYEAMDTIEGVRVALKVPHSHLITRDVLRDFRNEVRLVAQLDHPNILPLKNASFIDGRFVVAFPLGEKTLADRLHSRMSLSTALDLAEQILEALAYAHRWGVIHCDVKPENFILFPENRLRLTDFGVSKVAQRTIQASGSGTVGFIAPEQAMGKPSFRSDVFSAGLVLYRMLAGKLPEWPYDWPPAGFARIRSRLHPDLIELLRRAIIVDPRKRFADAEQMLAAFRRAKSKALNYSGGHHRRNGSTNGKASPDWQTVRRKQFQRQFGKALETRHSCSRCNGPVSEYMQACPWCGVVRKTHRDETQFPAKCPRCNRGMKLDWKFCPWCFGPGFEVTTSREFSDKRYRYRCSNASCGRKVLMPFMRYCPWCRRKVRRKWKLPGTRDHCQGCGSDVYASFWDFCPWCTKSLRR